MKEKVVDSVMECTDFMVLVCLLMACGLTLVFAETRQELNGPCHHGPDCNKIGYFCSANRTCQCIGPGYRPNNFWTKCVGRMRCKYDDQCIEGAYCTGESNRETCRCKEDEDYFPSEDDWTCINSGCLPHLKQTTSVFVLWTICWISLYLNT